MCVCLLCVLVGPRSVLPIGLFVAMYVLFFGGLGALKTSSVGGPSLSLSNAAARVLDDLSQEP